MARRTAGLRDLQRQDALLARRQARTPVRPVPCAGRAWPDNRRFHGARHWHGLRPAAAAPGTSRGAVSAKYSQPGPELFRRPPGSRSVAPGARAAHQGARAGWADPRLRAHQGPRPAPDAWPGAPVPDREARKLRGFTSRQTDLVAPASITFASITFLTGTHFAGLRSAWCNASWIRGRRCYVADKTVLFRPSALARYSAESARSINAATPDSGKDAAMPILAVTLIS